MEKSVTFVLFLLPDRMDSCHGFDLPTSDIFWRYVDDNGEYNI